MPKMKSHSGTKKRFRKTGTGKLMRAKAFKSHILSKKSTKRKRGFRQETEIAAADRKVIKSRLAEDRVPVFRFTVSEWIEHGTY